MTTALKSDTWLAPGSMCEVTCALVLQKYLNGFLRMVGQSPK